ncbi:Type II secretory pathway, pseudopilin PulG [Streptococcus gallolyticus]|uniref:competence type IV pilus minor pilin ComGE n=1 Tax=Streptococcus hepaticus TaxID=3349163 RepID=UPI001C97647A|nr:Type II secretory pathway, pseudopilin PulG [Streptococcus gallolyticus]MBY5040840.1 Type II secretory pathway, pseudopilin PulG [Streptococcus gallolyticus]
MVVIKNRKSKAYILLESLVALAVLTTVVSLFLTAIDQSRQQQVNSLQEQEILNLAKMVVQTKQARLELNGQSVTIERSQQKIRVLSQGKEILLVEKD